VQFYFDIRYLFQRVSSYQYSIALSLFLAIRFLLEVGQFIVDLAFLSLITNVHSILLAWSMCQ
jgi:hypothetical protein